MAVSGSVILLEAVPGTVLYLFGVRAAEIIAQGIPAIRIFAISLLGTSFSFLAMFYYMTIGHKKLSTAISIVQGLVVVVPAAYILSKLIGENGVWMSFSLAEIATMVLVWAWYRRLKAAEPGKYESILLLDKGRLAQEKSFEATAGNNSDEAAGVLRDISEFIDEAGLGAQAAQNLNLGVGEMVNNIVNHAYPGGKQGLMDVRVLYGQGAVKVCLRDSGSEVQPQGPDQRPGSPG